MVIFFVIFFQPLEKNNLSIVEEKEAVPLELYGSGAVSGSEDTNALPRLTIPSNREGTISPTGPPHSQPISPLRQKNQSPGNLLQDKN